jgi:hypothetical protein
MRGGLEPALIWCPALNYIPRTRKIWIPKLLGHRKKVRPTDKIFKYEFCDKRLGKHIHPFSEVESAFIDNLKWASYITVSRIFGNNRLYTAAFKLGARFSITWKWRCEHEYYQAIRRRGNLTVVSTLSTEGAPWTKYPALLIASNTIANIFE